MWDLQNNQNSTWTEKKMFKIYLVTHSLKSGKVSRCVLMLWCIKTHLKFAQEILYYKYLLFNVHSCKKDSLYAVEWDSECQAGLQNSCRWCSFQSRLKPHWAHQNHQELEAFRRVVIFKKHNDEGVRISKKHSNLYFTTECFLLIRHLTLCYCVGKLL